MSNASNLLLVFSCSFWLNHKKAQNSFNIHKSISWSTDCGGISDSHQTRKTALTVACFVPWCSMSHCLIWNSAATRLFGFVTLWALSTCSLYCVRIFYIWQEVGLFQLVCMSLFFMISKSWALISSMLFSQIICCCWLFFKWWHDSRSRGRTMQHFSPGYLNVMLFLACYWHIVLQEFK